MIIDWNGVNYVIDNKLAKMINILINKTIKYNDDAIIVFDGKEGAGKSELKQQIGHYISYVLKTQYNLDVPYSVDNVHFDLAKYVQASHNAWEKGYKSWINDLDEGRKIANRKKGNSKDVIAFTDYLSECRSKNQIHLLALPSYHDFNDYLVKHRMALLIHVKKDLVKDENEFGGFKLERGVINVYRVNDVLLKYYDNWRFKYKYPPPYTNYNEVRQNYFQARFRVSKPSILNSEEYENKKNYWQKIKYLEPTDDIDYVEIGDCKITPEVLKNFRERLSNREIGLLFKVHEKTIQRRGVKVDKKDKLINYKINDVGAGGLPL